MAKFPGHQLTEVLCGFWFDPESNQWDSTYFGEFHNLAKELGYNEKQEQKGFQIKFNLSPQNTESSKAEPNEMETRMVFKNPEKQSAIIVAPNYISIHKLPPYDSWERLLEEVEPLLDIYFSLSLGKSLLQANVAYINQIELDRFESISEKFGILPQADVLRPGLQQNLFFQSQYSFDPNLLAHLKLFQNKVSEKNIGFVFECSCLAINYTREDTWKNLIQAAHDKSNEIFNSIIKK